MSGENIRSPDVILPACSFFREVIADSRLTKHDICIVAKHTRVCADCEDTIGQMLHEQIEKDRLAGSTGA